MSKQAKVAPCGSSDRQSIQEFLLRRSLSRIGSLLIAVIFAAACSRQAPPPATAPGQGAASASSSGTSGTSGTSASLAAQLPAAATVTFAMPRGDVALPSMGAVAFDRPMVPLSAVDVPAAATQVSLDPPTPLRVQWLGTSTLGLWPTKPLAPATRYTVKLQGFHALDGKEVAAFSWQFRTSLPHVIRAWPHSGEDHVDPHSRIALEFDQPVDLASVEKLAHLEVKDAAAPQLKALPATAADLEWLHRRDPDPTAQAADLQARIVILQPKTPLPVDFDVALILAAGLHGQAGPEVSEAPYRYDFHTLGPLNIVSAACDAPCDPDAWTPVHVAFNNNLADTPKELLAKWITVEPSPPGLEVMCWGSDCSLHADPVVVPGKPAKSAWQPGQVYTIKVAAGFKDHWAQTLKDSKTFTVTMGHRLPSLAAATEGTFFERAEGPHRYGIDLRNVPMVKGRAMKVSRSNLAKVLDQLSDHPVPAGQRPLPPPRFEFNLDLGLQGSSQPDTDARRIIDLDKWLDNKPGALLIDVVAADSKLSADLSLRELVSVTDLQVMAKTSTKSTIFWVTSLKTGLPVAGADVAVVDATGNQVWRGASNAQGLVSGPGNPVTETRYSGEDEVPQGNDVKTVLASKDDDWTWLRLDGSLTSGSFWDGDGNGGRRGVLFADKNVYKRGEPVRFKGIVRTLEATGLAFAKAGDTIELELHDPEGHPQATLATTVSQLGSFDGQLSLPATAAYGTWSLVAKWGTTSIACDFQVLVYRTPKFKMSATVAKPHYTVGDVVTGDVLASYYSGGPLDNAPLTVAVSSFASTFEPPGWQGFSFEPGFDTSPSWSHSSQSRLDAKGHNSFSLPTKQLHFNSSQQFEAEFTATDPNDQPIAARTHGWLHPSSAHVGVRLSENWYQAGKPMLIEVIATDVDGKPLTGVPLGVQLVRREFKQVRQATIGGQFEWVTTPVEVPAGDCALTSASQPVTCAQIPPQAGSYTVQVVATDAQGRKSIAHAYAFVAGADAVAFDRDHEDSAVLVADKLRYKVGDVAKLLLKNKVGGKRALITLERDGVLETRSLDLAGDVTTIEVAIEAKHQPNFFVCAAVFSGRKAPAEVGKPDLGSPQLENDVINIAVDTADRATTLKLTPDKTRHRPGEEVSVALDLRDAAGQPVAGEVTLWAVDEGVLALTNHQTPDPLADLFAPAQRGVGDFATVEALVRGKLGEEKGADGGGGGIGHNRSDLRDVAVWLPSLAVGANGQATAKFKLPENLTTFRVMAVATSGPDRAGHGQAAIQVDKPLMLLATWPRQVHLGDTFEVAVVARNRSPGELRGAAKLTLTADSGQGAIAGDAEKALVISKDTSTELGFKVRATHAGRFKVALHVDAAGAKGDDGKPLHESDGIEDTVEVVDPALVETVATYDESSGPAKQAIEKAQARPGVGGLEISASANGLIGIRGALDFLVEYPYGCTEQLTSQLLALLWKDQVSSAFDLSETDKQKVRAMAQEAVDQIVARRVFGGGGLRLWPGDGEADLHATAWALRVLVDAKGDGLRVDPDLLRDGPAWLRQRLSPSPGQLHLDRFGNESPQAPPTLDDQAMVVATLAALGQPADGDVDLLFAKRQELSPSGQLWLAEAAMVDATGAERARTLVNDLLRVLHVDAATAHLEQSESMGWSSEVRTNAQLLAVMLKATPDQPMLSRVARWLLDRRGPQSRSSTQENAWILRSLGTYLQQRDHGGDLNLQVQLGDKKLAPARLSHRALDPWKVLIGQDDLAKGTSNLLLDKDGAGTLYYTLRYSYALAVEAEVAKNAGFFVKRAVVDEGGRTGFDHIDRGQNVIVTVLLLADRDRDDVAVVDQLPAGLEPMDLSLETSTKSVQATLDRLRGAVLGADANLLPTAGPQRAPAHDIVSHRELAGREVRWFVDHLPQGMHTFSYVARAAVRGDFLGRGVRAEAMYRPEVFGTSGPNRLRVD